MKLGFPKNPRLKASIVISLLFLFIIVCNFVVLSKVSDEKKMLDETKRHIAEMEEILQVKTSLIQAYKNADAVYSRYHYQFPKTQLVFLSALEQELAASGVKVNSINPGSQENGNANPLVTGKISVNLSFKGPYYSILGVLADWRSMSTLLRLDSLTLSSTQSEAVEGTAVLESELDGGGSR